MACTETNLPSSSRASKIGLLVVAVPKDTVSSHSKNKKKLQKQSMMYRTIMIRSNARRETMMKLFKVAAYPCHFEDMKF